MKISRDEISHVADLARLDLDDAAIDQFVGQIGDILQYVEMLGQVDTEGIEPTSHAIFLSNAFREDEPAGHMARDDALANAPQQDGETFLVPKVIG